MNSEGDFKNKETSSSVFDVEDGFTRSTMAEEGESMRAQTRAVDLASLGFSRDGVSQYESLNFSYAPNFTEKNKEPVYRSVKISAAAPAPLVERFDALSLQQKATPQNEKSTKGHTPPVLGGAYIILNKNHTCCVKASLSLLIKTMSLFFTETDSDVSYDEEKCRWNGNIYCPQACASLRFRVYLYTVSEGADLFTMEFDRMQGCAFGFQKMYIALYKKFVEIGIAFTESGEKMTAVPKQLQNTSQPFAAPNLSGLDQRPSFGSSVEEKSLLNEVEEDDDLLENVDLMASSEYLEVQQAGSQQLALLSKICPFKVQKSISTAVENARSADVDVKSNGIETLCNLNKNKSCRNDMVASGAVETLCEIAKEGCDLYSAHLKRKSMDMLISLYFDYPKEVADAGGQEIFETMKLSTDPRIKASWRKIQDSLDLQIQNSVNVF